MAESSIGTVPVNWLSKRESPANFESLLIVGGIVDVSLFDPRSSTPSFVNCPISVGIEEEIWFSNNDSRVKFLASNNSGTRTPEYLFDDRSSTCRSFRFEMIEDGISPERKFFRVLSDRTVSDKIPSSAGSVPSSRFVTNRFFSC